MEMVQKQIEVPKEMSELAEGLVKLVIVAKQLLADGFQPGQDLPPFAVAAFAELPAMVGGLEQLPAEVQGDKGKLALALLVAADKLV